MSKQRRRSTDCRSVDNSYVAQVMTAEENCDIGKENCYE